MYKSQISYKYGVLQILCTDIMTLCLQLPIVNPGNAMYEPNISERYKS
jgi:hypothetical protein